MRVGERGDSDRHRTPVRSEKPKETQKPREVRSGDDNRQPRTTSPSESSSPSARRTRISSLDRDPEGTRSDAAAGREVTRRQSETAARLTGDQDGETSFDRLAAEEEAETDRETRRAGTSPGVQRLLNEDRASALSNEDRADLEKLDHIVDNPVEEEQRADIQTPAPFQAGSPQPQIPNFQGQTPASSRSTPTGGTEDTFVQNGVTYTRTTRPDGSVSTTYEQNGVDYSNTRYEDGRSSTLVSNDTETGLHTRTIETTADGKVTDTSRSLQGVIDPRSGEYSSQSREESIGPDGVRTVNEEVLRPDGGRANITRTVQPDGRVNEVYNYQGDQGTVNRTTNQAANGTAETRTERTYTVDQNVESLIDSPPVPEGIEHQIVPLPQNDRGETTVRQVEVVTTDASGAETLQYAEDSYSQSSGDVQLQGSRELGYGSPGDTFHQPILPNNEDSSITHTVTRVRARDENGNLVESTGASQTLHLVGDRPAELGGPGQVSVDRTDSWNPSGESSSTFATHGFREEDLFGLSYGGDQVGGFPAVVGGSGYVTAGYPDSGVSPFDAYNRKGGGELSDWLDTDHSDPLDVSVTVNRNAEGDTTSRNLSLSTVDEHGNGKVATRSDNGGAVGWTYTDYSNGGQDYRRQTVFEGTDISIYESHEVTGPGQFRTTSETREGDDVVSNSEISRQEVSQEQLRQSVADGELTQAQVDRMLRDGPPYYAERLTEHAAPLLDDDGELRKDEDGNVIQRGHDIASTTLSNGDGYSVSQHYRKDQGGENGAIYTESRLNTVTDPSVDPPLTGQLHTQAMNAETCRLETLEQGNIQVGANGQIRYGGQEVGQFDFGGSELSTLLREGKSVTSNDLIGVLGKAAAAGDEAGVLHSFGGIGRVQFTPNSSVLGRLGGAADLFGVVAGAQGVFSGIQEGDERAILEGAGNIAGGLNSLAAATSALAGGSRLGAAASRFSTLTATTSTLGKALGVAGGVASLGFGLYDVFTADSGWDKAAGGLAAAAGAVAIGSAFFGPPGWVVGGLISGALGIASIFVGGGDDNQTAPMDDRLRG